MIKALDKNLKPIDNLFELIFCNIDFVFKNMIGQQLNVP